jgi:hypothetical protein
MKRKSVEEDYTIARKLVGYKKLKECIDVRDLSDLAKLLTDGVDVNFTPNQALSPLLYAVRAPWPIGITLIEECGGKCFVFLDPFFYLSVFSMSPLELWTVQQMINQRWIALVKVLRMSILAPWSKMVVQYAHGEFLSNEWKSKLPTELWNHVGLFLGERVETEVLRRHFCPLNKVW